MTPTNSSAGRGRRPWRAAPRYLHASSTDDLARMVTGLTEELVGAPRPGDAAGRAVADAGVLAADTVDEAGPPTRLARVPATERLRLIRRVLGAPLADRV